MRSWRKLRGLAVVTLDEGAIVGRLIDFQFDLITGGVYGWRIRSGGMFGRAGGVAARDVGLLGRDAVLLRSGDAVEWAGGQPRAVDGRGWASHVLGRGVMTRAGEAVGAVKDLALHEDGRVLALLLDGERVLPLEARLRLGPEVAIVEARDAVQELPDPPTERDELWRRRAERPPEPDQ